MGRFVDIIIGILFFIVMGITVVCLLPIMVVIGICLLIYLPIEYSLLFIDKYINKTNKNEEA